MKKIFSSIGVVSMAISDANEDTDRALGWIEKELGEVEAIINAHSDYCAMIGSCNMDSVPEKVVCNHVKVVGEDNFCIAVEDIKAPSKRVLGAAKRFFFELWDKGGRQLAALEATEYTRKVGLQACTVEALNHELSLILTLPLFL